MLVRPASWINGTPPSGWVWMVRSRYWAGPPLKRRGRVESWCVPIVIEIAAQPTWGADVGAATAIRQALIDLRNEGVAILLISEELEELFELSDRIVVIAEGRLSPDKRTADTDMEEIGLWMSGLFPGGKDEAGKRAEGASGAV